MGVLYQTMRHNKQRLPGFRCGAGGDPVCTMWLTNGAACRDLPTCGVFRGNRAPASERAASASLRPLAVHQYSFGSQSCRIRRVPAQSARLSAAKDAAFVTLMSSRRILRLAASGPVRRVAAPAACRSIHSAILRRRIRLLVSLASRLGNPRTAPPRLTPPAAPNLPRSRTQVLRLRLSTGQRGKQGFSGP